MLNSIGIYSSFFKNCCSVNEGYITGPPQCKVANNQAPINRYTQSNNQKLSSSFHSNYPHLLTLSLLMYNKKFFTVKKFLKLANS